MKKIVLVSLIASSVMFASVSEEDSIKKEAVKAIKKLAKTLKANLKENIRKGGVPQAAEFCSKEATSIVSKINSDLNGATIKRVSLKYRNPNAKPSEDEQKVLKDLEKKVLNHQSIPKVIVKKISDKRYKVYKPIFIKKNVCLLCHGDNKHRDFSAYKIIKENYPNDKAIDYKNGDLRGAFVVEINKK